MNSFLYSIAGAGDIIHRLHTRDDISRMQTGDEVWIFSPNKGTPAIFKRLGLSLDIKYFPNKERDKYPHLIDHYTLGKHREKYLPLTFHHGNESYSIEACRDKMLFCPFSNSGNSFSDNLSKVIVHNIPEALYCNVNPAKEVWPLHTRPLSLSLPGLYEAIKISKGLITSLTVSCMMGWFLRKPMFWMCSKKHMDKEVAKRHPSEYGQMIPGNMVTTFEDFSVDKLTQWYNNIHQ